MPELQLHLSTLFLLSALAVLTWTDARTRRLPDVITLPLIAVGLLVNTFMTHTPVNALIGAGIGYGGFWAVSALYLRLRGRWGQGLGDAKLLAAGGAWCGAWMLPFILLLGVGSALVFVVLMHALRREPIRRDTSVALGAWLAPAIGLIWLYRVYGPGLASGL